ncbi:MAG: Fic family protein [Candidatus Methanoperedens sp.]|nr:Fic family protein [Candidatus Methanoperedens sp.]
MSNTDTSLIQEDILLRIKEKTKRLNSMHPLPKDAVKRFREDLRLQHTYHSNAIGGNTLTLPETRLVIEEGITTGGKTLREHLEAINSAKAYDLIEDIAGKKKEIEHDTILQIHETVMGGILEDAGKYRDKNIRTTSPDWSQVIRLMDKLIKEISWSNMHPVGISAFLHHGFLNFHPFVDGNGRVARLLTNLYLIARDYPPIILKKGDKMRYFRSLKAADAGNPAPFANFIAKAVDESLSLHLSTFGGNDKLLPLKELARETPYSQEYLSLRARQGFLDSIKTGRVWYSSKRAVGEYVSGHGKK